MQICPNPEAHTDQMEYFGECSWCHKVNLAGTALPADLELLLQDPDAEDGDIEHEIERAGWSVDVQDAMRNSEPEDSRLRFILNRRLANMYGR